MAYCNIFLKDLLYSNETFNEDAAAQGARTSDTRRNAPISDKCASKLTPDIFASTAPAPKISAKMAALPCVASASSY